MRRKWGIVETLDVLYEWRDRLNDFRYHHLPVLVRRR